MACDQRLVLASARSQIGYMEKETWDQLDDFNANAGDGNFVKYSRDLAKLNYFNGSKKGIAWCSIFVSWNYVQTYGVNAARKQLCHPVTDNCGAGCNSAMNYFKRKDRFFTTPQPGDVIFFWNAAKTEASHTGHVEKVDSVYVYTIEGNTSGDSGVVANGGMVAAKKYRLNYARIAGYGRPDYASVEPDNNSNNAETGQEQERDETMYIGTAIVAPKTGKGVNFRRSPSRTAARVSGCMTIPTGACVNIKSIEGDGTWASIEYNGYNGYMMMEYLVATLFNGDTTASNMKSVDEIIAQITTLLAELATRAR